MELIWANCEDFVGARRFAALIRTAYIPRGPPAVEPGATVGTVGARVTWVVGVRLGTVGSIVGVGVVEGVSVGVHVGLAVWVQVGVRLGVIVRVLVGVRVAVGISVGGRYRLFTKGNRRCTGEGVGVGVLTSGAT